MASPSLPLTSAISTGAWGRPLRPMQRVGPWDVTPVPPPPPAPAIGVRHRVAKRRVVTEILIAAVLLSILGALFDPTSSQPRLGAMVARMSTDLLALQSSAAGAGAPSNGTPSNGTPSNGTPSDGTPSVDAQASEAKLKADITEALRVQPPTDAVAADSWKYALSEATAAIDELNQVPPNRPVAETDLATSLQALLLVEPNQRS